MNFITPIELIFDITRINKVNMFLVKNIYDSDSDSFALKISCYKSPRTIQYTHFSTIIGTTSNGNFKFSIEELCKSEGRAMYTLLRKINKPLARNIKIQH